MKTKKSITRGGQPIETITDHVEKLKLRMNEELKKWNEQAKQVLQGKTIVEVRYLNDDEMEMMGWDKRPICFFLNDGTSCIISMDDEGNDGGALFYNDNGVLPTLQKRFISVR